MYFLPIAASSCIAIKMIFNQPTTVKLVTKSNFTLQLFLIQCRNYKKEQKLTSLPSYIGPSKKQKNKVELYKKILLLSFSVETEELLPLLPCHSNCYHTYHVTLEILLNTVNIHRSVGRTIYSLYFWGLVLLVDVLVFVCI